MAQNRITGTFTAVASGAQVEDIALSDMYQQYKVTSGTISYTAADSLTIRINGTAYHGMVLEIEFDCDITLANSAVAKIQTSGAFSFSVKGDDSGTLPAIYANKKFTLYAKYTGSTWSVQYFPSVDETAFITGAMLTSDADITPGKLALAEGSIIVGNSSTVGVALDAKTSGYIPIGNGTTVTSVAVSGDITLSSTGVVAIAAGVIVNADINASAAIAFSKLASLTSANILVGSAGNVATSTAVSGDISISNAGVVAIAAGVIEEADLTANLTYEIIPLLVSFEAAGGVFASVGDFKIKMPYPGTVTEIYAYAVDAIAATDNGTIQAKNNAGTNMTNGLVTFTASDTRGTAYTVTPSADNTFIAGDILTFTTAKVTAGGVVQLSIKVTRT